MYDEIVKRLRAAADNHHEKCDGCPYEEDYPCCVDCLDKMHKQAADAIEELSADCDMYRKGMTDEHNKAARLLWDKEHCWIPVTERLPEAGERVLILNGKGFVCEAYVSDRKRWMRHGCYMDYMETTHWMPLPEPPKEE